MLSDDNRVLHYLFILVRRDIFVHTQITQELCRVNVIVLKGLTLEQYFTPCGWILHIYRAVRSNSAGSVTCSATVYNGVRRCSCGNESIDILTFNTVVADIVC